MYGYFDDRNREYVITRPDTPLPWINYLGCEKYFGIISNTAGGYSFYRDARLRRITRYRYNNVPPDSGGRYLYIKDGDTVWNPGWKPTRSPLDQYACRHGLGYTEIMGKKNGVEARVAYFVPLGEDLEIWDLELSNHTAEVKELVLFSFVEFCLWDALDDMTNFQRNYSTGEVEVENSTVFHKTEYRERRDHYAYFTCSRDIDGFDTCRDAFLGRHNGFENPAAVAAGACRNSIATGWAPVGAHQLNIVLPPGSSERLHFILGYMENEAEHKFSAPDRINKRSYYGKLKEYRDPGAVDRARRDLKRYWDGLLGRFSVRVDNEQVSRMLNTWNQYQCMVTFNLSRSASLYESGVKRGIGFRDSNQDLLGLVHMVPERARQRILEVAAVQFADGSCHHQYQPLTRQGNNDIGGGFNDDPLWLVVSTCAYIKETGDLSILEEKVGYADDPRRQDSLLEHLQLSARFTLKNLGRHNLPLIGHADWNDCLNLNCFSRVPGENFQVARGKAGEAAESVMIAGLFLYTCRELIALLKHLGEVEQCGEFAQGYRLVLEAVERHGWDGEWFLRAYDHYGEKIGSRECSEGKIFIESQGWCIMGGAGLQNGRARRALDSVEKYLATPNGIMLHQPAYTRYHLNLGEISSYPPGHKENAGIFCHNNPWIVIAEAMLGNGDRAFDYYMRTLPSTKEKVIETYRCEPYCYAQVVAGADSAAYGEAKNSWLTGTAAWSFIAATQAILGIKPDYRGLLIDPCIPGDWRRYSVTRFFRGSWYGINVENPSGAGKGVTRLVVNGKEIDGNLVPLQREGSEVKVTAVLGG